MFQGSMCATETVMGLPLRTICTLPRNLDKTERVREQCDLVWLENLNLRGGFKSVIMDYIAEKQSELMPLYEEIYQHGSREYWRSHTRNCKNDFLCMPHHFAAV